MKDNSYTETPDYWCSWQLQNIWAEADTSSNAFGSTGHGPIAATLTQHALDEIWKSDMLNGVRGQVYALLDLGWDIPLGTDFNGKHWMLGSMIPASDKFPDCTGTPAQRLKKLNEFVREFGFKGVGLWIPANAYGDGKDGRAFTDAEQEDFYRERFGWMKEAGIRYLKMDYGIHDHDLGFRRRITELAKQIAPDMLIEHAYNCGPFNDDITPWDTPDVKRSGRFDVWDNGKRAHYFEDTVRVSRVFRTYDVSFCLAVPTTLDRAAVSLAVDGCAERCTVNVESQPEIAAVLGCSMGIMECYRPEQERACRRALLWHRLAPAWSVCGDITVSAERLDDTWHFPAGSDWIDFIPDGYAVKQGAPAVISRGRTLPEIGCSGERPYLIASRHPNGMQAVATLPRRSVEKGEYWPLADVTLDGCLPDTPIAVFGRFGSLTLVLDEGRHPLRVWMRDLIGDTATDKTAECRVSGSSLTVPGGVLDGYLRPDDDRLGLVITIEV